jgi:quercetin dioxygenase-like cupin family protein
MYDRGANDRGNAMLKKSIIVAAALALGGVAFAQAPGTQTAGLKRTIVQKFDVPPGERETVVAVVDIPANADVARHTHPGPETDYVLEGDLILDVQGVGPKPYKAGDSFYIPAGTVHGGKGGSNGAKIVSVYIVEKGKPLATPVP